MKHRQTRRNLLVCLAVVLCVISTAGTTQAAWRVAAPSVHAVDLAGVQGMIVEEYIEASDVYPGATVSKIVNVKNTGQADCLVRVSLAPAWRDGSLSADNIRLHVNTRYWQLEPDGYYYYKGVLAPGESTLEPLLNSFSIDEETGNEYAGLTADILVKMECVQAAGGGIALWGKTLGEIGVSYQAQGSSLAATKVEFTSKKEFVFDPETTDLFANFKRLLPGETRTQSIEVANTSGEPAELFLRAEDINQSFAEDPETLALVTRLLREYATITVTDERGEVLYSGPVWGDPLSGRANPASMSNDVSLGIFAAAQRKTLHVELILAPQLGNEYQGLLGLIKWVWSAQGISEPGPEPPTTPTTSTTATTTTNTMPTTSTTATTTTNIMPTTSTTATTTTNIMPTTSTTATTTTTQPPTNPPVIQPPRTGTVTIQGAKTWRHGSLPANQRPKSLEIIVKADGKTVLTDAFTAADHWKWSFELPKYDAAGKEISYVVEEARLPGYATTIDGYNVTNTHESYAEVELSGTKIWDHSGNRGQAPQSIVVHMLDDGMIVASKRVTAENGWAYRFTLPKYREDGSVARYTVAEDPVPGYTMTPTGGGYGMKNVYKGANYPGDPIDFPNTGGNSRLWIWVGMMLVSFAFLVVVLAQGGRKRKGYLA
ncbi:MAG: Cna B-type domain-containing protein [Oscillospiraceae bacterium]|jgi:hypothetical protein|nr:Cna B-type domain-containing protein [Oscillospiraceae bacterium]